MPHATIKFFLCHVLYMYDYDAVSSVLLCVHCILLEVVKTTRY